MKNSEVALLPINQPEAFNCLHVEEQTALLNWIDQNIRGNERRMLKYDSYKLKHLYSSYIENGAFKGAMLEAGYSVVDTNRINWKFKKGGKK